MIDPSCSVTRRVSARSRDDAAAGRRQSRIWRMLVLLPSAVAAPLHALK